MEKTFEEIIKQRRSIRVFKEDVIPAKDIKEILEAGVWSPTGCNMQEIRFLVVNKDNMTGLLKFKPFFKNVSHFILVFYDTSLSQSKKMYQRSKHQRTLPYIDSGIAMQSMVLKAKSKGIDSCMCNLSEYYFTPTTNFKTKVFRHMSCFLKIHNDSNDNFQNYLTTELKVPNKYKIVGGIALGYGVKQPKLEVTCHGGKKVMRKDVEHYLVDKPEKMKVLFVGQFTLHNSYGGQALAFPIMDKLRENFDAEFSYLIRDKYFDQNLNFADKKGYDIIKYPYPIFFKDSNIKNAIKNADLIIDVSGIEFIGERGFFRRWFHFLRVAYPQWLAKRYGKTYLKSSISYGGFPTWFFRFMVRRILNQVPFVFVRGDENCREVKELNIKTPLYSFPDVALIQKPESEDWAKKYLKKLGLNPARKIIGISPSSIMNNRTLFKTNSKNSCGKNHMRLIREVIKYFLKKNLQVLIIPHSFIDGKDIDECDLAFSRQIMNQIDDKNLFLIDEMYLEYKQIKSIVKLMDFYVTSRYHGLASALSSGVPTVALAWHVKYKDLMKLYIPACPCIDSREVNVNDSMKLIKGYYKNQKWFKKEQWEKKSKKAQDDVNYMINKMMNYVRV